MKFLKKLLLAANERVETYGSQYTTFSIFGIINYPLAYLIERYNNLEVHGSFIRILALLLCVILLFRNKWPEPLRKFIPLYWYFTVGFCTAFLVTYLLISSSFSLGWLINFNMGVMILILLVDVSSFLFLQFWGMILAGLLYFTINHNFPPLPSQDEEILFLFMFFSVTVYGSLFSKNREIYNNYAQKAIENANSNLEQKVHERTKELEKALQVKTDFLNNISHEIRTPIQGFTIISEALVEKWDIFPEKKRIELSTIVASNARRLSNLVGGLLDLSKFNEGKFVFSFEDADFIELVKSMVDECKSLYLSQKNIDIILETNLENAVIRCDKEKLSQVLRNLFTNAIKFTDGSNGEKIICRVYQTVSNNENPEELIHFEIRDEGIGIPPGEEEAIFSPFTQSTLTRTKAGGTGLGLSIAREIIKAHDGKIWAKRGDGEDRPGSIFQFVIPKARKFKEESQVSIKNPVNKTSRKQIIIIDDEDSCLLSMDLILDESGYNLIKAKTFNEAMDYLQGEGRGKVGLIMLDLMMPEVYGIEALIQLKSNNSTKDIPIILQSGASDENEIDKAMGLGVVSFVKKPYEKAKILDIIGKYAG